MFALRRASPRLAMDLLIYKPSIVKEGYVVCTRISLSDLRSRVFCLHPSYDSM